MPEPKSIKEIEKYSDEQLNNLSVSTLSFMLSQIDKEKNPDLYSRIAKSIKRDRKISPTEEYKQEINILKTVFMPLTSLTKLITLACCILFFVMLFFSWSSTTMYEINITEGSFSYLAGYVFSGIISYNWDIKIAGYLLLAGYLSMLTAFFFIWIAGIFSCWNKIIFPKYVYIGLKTFSSLMVLTTFFLALAFKIAGPAMFIALFALQIITIISPVSGLKSKSSSDNSDGQSSKNISDARFALKQYLSYPEYDFLEIINYRSSVLNIRIAKNFLSHLNGIHIVEIFFKDLDNMPESDFIKAGENLFWQKEHDILEHGSCFLKEKSPDCFKISLSGVIINRAFILEKSVQDGNTVWKLSPDRNPDND